MKYVALLRGINVGGNSKVDMKQLKAAFETVGMRDVQTYINSGNVIFTHDEALTNDLAEMLRRVIQSEFMFAVDLIVKAYDEMRAIVKVIPPEWQNNSAMKCDVVFLWDTWTEADALAQFKPRDDIDDVRTAPGAIIWKVDRENVTRSGLVGIIGLPFYRQVTIRNCNTSRKLLALMDQV